MADVVRPHTADPLGRLGGAWRVVGVGVASMTERDFQRRVLDTARLFGWRIYHHRPAMQGGRVVTALEGDAGFPDLILCRPPRLIFAELKVGRNKPSESQWEWLNALGDCNDAEAYLWRPESWGKILDCLRDRNQRYQWNEYNRVAGSEVPSRVEVAVLPGTEPGES